MGDMAGGEGGLREDSQAFSFLLSINSETMCLFGFFMLYKKKLSDSACHTACTLVNKTTRVAE